MKSFPVPWKRLYTFSFNDKFEIILFIFLLLSFGKVFKIFGTFSLMSLLTLQVGLLIRFQIMLSHYLKEVIKLVFWYINFETISFNLDNMGQTQFLCDDTSHHLIEMLILLDRENKLWPYIQIIGDDSFDDLYSSFCIRE